MKWKAILLFLAVIATSLAVVYLVPLWKSAKTNPQQSNHRPNQSGRRSEWTYNNDYGVELWIAWTEEHDSGIGPYRNIYALMEQQHFNEVTLRIVLGKMAAENLEFKSVSIRLCSDEEELAWQVYDHRFNGLREVPTKEQLEHQKKPKNYLYGGYSRTTWPNGLEEEQIYYTPNLRDERMVTIKLKP